MIERVVVISDDAVESGGAAGIALRSVRLLRNRGIPVTVLNGSGGEESAIGESGAELRSLGSRSLLQGNRGTAAIRGLFNRAALGFVDRWIRQNDSPGTVYHLHNWHKVLSPSVFLPLKRVAGRLVMTAHDYFLVCPNGGQFDFPRGAACERVPNSLDCVTTNCDRRHYGHKLWRAGRHTVREAMIDFSRTPATVIAVHDGMRTYLERGGVAPDGITVLRNPVVPWRTERVTAERNRDVLFVGRLERDKGVDVIAAAAHAAKVPFRVIGEGPLKEELSRTYPEIRMMGWRSPAEIAVLVQTARLMVVPTRWRETFGLVTLEAAMSGVPVLVSRHALIAPEVVDTGCAEVCDPDDAAALARQLGRLATDDLHVHRMSEAGYHHGPALAPTPEAWCDGLIAIYEAKLSTAAASRRLPAPPTALAALG